MPWNPRFPRIGAPPRYSPYTGQYLLGPTRVEVRVKVKEARLNVVFPGDQIAVLDDPDGHGRWKVTGEPSWMTFDWDSSGRVNALNLVQTFPMPRGKNAAARIEKTARENGPQAAVEEYRRFKADPEAGYVFNERGFNAVGYNLLGSGKIDEAIAVFQLNTEAFPGSSNAWDSLAEAWMTKGDREKAVAYYKKSVELDPGNENAKKKLEELAKNP